VRRHASMPGVLARTLILDALAGPREVLGK
jgi:hypothetical protein